MGRKVISLLALVLCLAAAGTARAEDEAAVVRQVIEDSIGWALDKDFDRLFEVMAHDENFFIFHPDSSTVEGWESFVEHSAVWKDPRFKATSFEVKDFRLNFSRGGDVAWFACYLDDFGEWDGRQIGWENVRWTGVAEKRDGKWVLVQMHFSFPNDLPAEDDAEAK